jgi:hypothetical protein
MRKPVEIDGWTDCSSSSDDDDEYGYYYEGEDDEEDDLFDMFEHIFRQEQQQGYNRGYSGRFGGGRGYSSQNYHESESYADSQRRQAKEKKRKAETTE